MLITFFGLILWVSISSWHSGMKALHKSGALDGNLLSMVCLPRHQLVLHLKVMQPSGRSLEGYDLQAILYHPLTLIQLQRHLGDVQICHSKTLLISLHNPLVQLLLHCGIQGMATPSLEASWLSGHSAWVFERLRQVQPLSHPISHSHTRNTKFLRKRCKTTARDSP